MAAASKKKARKKSSKKVARKTAKKVARKAKKKPGTKKTTVKKKSTSSLRQKKSAKKKAVKKAKRTTKSAATASKRKSKPKTAKASKYKPRAGEKYMNESQLEHFRGILSTWRNQLVSDINRTIHTMQDETINHPDPNDRATQETDMSLELRNRDRERKLIKKIDETLARIKDDDYGFCEKCGIEIGVARLEARPTATLCVDCKTLDEIRERQLV